MRVKQIHIIPRLAMEPAELRIELDDFFLVGVPLSGDPKALVADLAAAVAKLKKHIAAGVRTRIDKAKEPK